MTHPFPVDILKSVAFEVSLSHNGGFIRKASSLMALLLIFASPAIQAADHIGCLMLKSDAQAFTSLDAESDSVQLKEGVIIPILGRSPDKKSFKVMIYGKPYWVQKAGHRAGTAKSCALFPKCFTASRNTKTYEKPSLNANQVSSTSRGSQLDWFGEFKVTSKTASGGKSKTSWYQVMVADRYAWVPGADGMLSGESCRGSLFESKRRWFFNVEAAYESNVSPDAYTGVITPVPDPTSVACLQNPLFRGVDKGLGQRYGAHTSHNFNNWLTFRAGLAYEQLTYKVSFLNNPHPDPGNTNCNVITVNVNDLTGGEDTITENNIMAPIGAFYRWQPGRNHSFLFGGEANPTFTITSGYEYKFFTGQTLSKQTENIGTITPTQFRFLSNFEIRYIYQFPYTQQEYFGLSVFAKMGMTGEYLFGLGLYL